MSSMLKITHFNPRSGERSDLNDHLYQIRNKKFQSTLRRTERLDNLKLGYGGTKISIHAPANGATSGDPTAGTVEAFQSTLRRTERLDVSISNDNDNAISIHAPANGATYSS